MLKGYSKMGMKHLAWDILSMDFMDGGHDDPGFFLQGIL